MSAQEQIGKLQGLLARIQRNAGAPRVSAPTAAAPLAAAPAAAPADQSVDDLLDGAPVPSPMPLEVDVALDSVPPAESEPIPLVASSTSAAASPTEDAFGMDSEVSEVRATTGPREPAAEVTVAAIEAEAEAEPAGEELSEDDLVEVTDLTSIPPAAATDVDIDFDEEEEQAPASSQRSKVASSMDEALAAAAEQLEAEREVPLKTPPPESGPQEAPMPPAMGAPAAPDVDALLGDELDIPTREQGRAGPTPEQLGQTIDLEEARGPSLELAEQQAAAAPAPAAVEELEVALPGRETFGSYDDNLQPPPEARDELAAHRRRQDDDDIAPPPESLAQLPSVQPGPAPEIIAAEASGPEIIARQIPVGTPDAYGSPRETFRPRSFVELLDASLGLGG